MEIKKKRELTTESLDEKKVLKIKKEEEAPSNSDMNADMGDASPVDQPPMGDEMQQNDMDMQNSEPPMDDIGDIPTDGQNIGSGDGMMPEGGDDEISSMFSQLSPDDQKAAKSYIESMINRDETQQEAPVDDADMRNGIPMESIILTKKQLNKLNEEFGIVSLSNDDKKTPEKKVNKKTVNTPFSSPKFDNRK